MKTTRLSVSGVLLRISHWRPDIPVTTGASVAVGGAYCPPLRTVGQSHSHSRLWIDPLPGSEERQRDGERQPAYFSLGWEILHNWFEGILIRGRCQSDRSWIHLDTQTIWIVSVCVVRQIALQCKLKNHTTCDIQQLHQTSEMNMKRVCTSRSP